MRVLAAVMLLTAATAFQFLPSVGFPSRVMSQSQSTAHQARSCLSMGYVPDGLSKEQYANLKKKEADAHAKKKFGAGGVRGFQSRSMQSFVAALEKGEAKHLMPVDPDKVRRGEIPLKDVPYMQRGGSWDNSDIAGKKGWHKAGSGKMKAFNDGKAAKVKSNKLDKVYNGRKPSVNVFGVGENLDWTGRKEHKAAPAARAAGSGATRAKGVASRSGKNAHEAPEKKKGWFW